MTYSNSETSKRYLTNRFCMIMECMGIAATSDPRMASTGCLYLEYNRTMGGYVVRKQATEGGAVSSPFGSTRYKPREFQAFLNGLFEAHQHYVKMLSKHK